MSVSERILSIFNSIVTDDGGEDLLPITLDTSFIVLDLFSTTIRFRVGPAIEKEFNIWISDETWEGWKRVRDAVTTVETYIK